MSYDHKEWLKNNPTYMKEYREKNRKQILLQRADWRRRRGIPAKKKTGIENKDRKRKYNNYYSKKRKADKLNRTPKWADLKAIRKFYENCPKGYEVDHIVPLKGKNVSGLHTMENLQYLKAEDNRKKSNKF